MGSIDNRIVRMEFDNAKFQSGVSQSQDSLNDLSSTIKNVSKSTQLDGISSGVETIASKFTSLNVIGAAALANMTNEAIKFGKSMIANVTTPLIEGGKNRALNIEQAKFQFKGLGLDVDKTMESASKAVQGTAYGLDEAAKIAGIFGTSGMQAGEEMTTALRAVAGAAAMTGTPFMQIGDVFTDVSGKGRVMAEDFNRLAARGINAQDVMAKYLRKTGIDANATQESVREMASKGQIDSKLFMAAMDDAFGKHATKANEIYTGSLANMNAALSRVGASFQAIKLEKRRKIFNTLTPAINAFHTSLSPVIDLYQRWQDYSGGVIIKGIESLMPLIEGLQKPLTVFAEGMDQLGVSAQSLIKPIKEAFSDVFGGTDFTKILLDGLTKAATGFKNFTKSLELSAKAQETVKKGFTTLFKGVDAGVAGLKAVGRVIEAVTKSIKNFAKGFAEALKLPGGLSDALSEMFDKAKAGFDSLGTSLEGLGKGLGAILGKGLSKLLDILSDIGGWISDNIAFKDILAGIFGTGTILSFKKIYELLDNVTEFTDKLSELFEKGANLSKAGSGISSLLDQVGESISVFISSIKVVSLALIAGSIALLASSLRNLSEIDQKKLAPALGAMSALFIMLSASLTSFSKTLSIFGSGGLISAGAGLLLVAFAVKTMSTAVLKLSDADPKGLAKGLGGISVILAALSGFLRTAKFGAFNIGSAIGIMLLASALKSIADAVADIGAIDGGSLAKGLGGLTGVLLVMAKTMKALGKVPWKSALGSTASILVFSFSLKKIVEAMQAIGSMDAGSIVKALGGFAGIFLELSLLTKAMGKIKVGKALGNSAAILILSKSLGEIGDALFSVGLLEWEDIAQGLAGIGGALAEMSIMLGVMGKLKVKGAISNSAGILIAAQALDDIAKALQEVSKLSWQGVLKGMSGIGAVLGELGIVLGVMGKISPLGSIFASVGILIAVEALDDIAKALQEVSKLSWQGILKGMSGIGAVLAELGIVLTAMGKLSPLGSVLASAAILIAVQSLEDIAKALQEVSKLSWEGVLKGLVGIGGVLAELGIVLTAMGMLAPLTGVLGAASILIAVESLDEIGAALQQIGALQWGEIARGLTGMGGAFVVLAGGSIINSLSAIGGLSMKPAVDNLNTLGNGLEKFASMSWDDIGRGLTAMSGALVVIAYGSLANTLGIIGAMSIEKVAAPLGVLADSVKKWTGVTVPPNMETGLSSLARGVEQWTLTALGAIGIEKSAAPLGILADSVKKWAGVVVPADMRTNLESLAAGVQSWSFAFAGAWALGIAPSGLGLLADAVKKWNGVTVPPNMESNLRSLANGVQAWSFAFVGAWALGIAPSGLAKLSDAIKKWNGVTVPPNMESNLRSLANGVQAWSFAFVGAWAMGTAPTSLTKLADSVKKWNGVTVPPNMEANLRSLANGAQAWSFAFIGTWAMGTAPSSLNKLADSVKKWNGVTVPPNMKANLVSLSEGVQSWSFAFAGAWSAGNASESLNKLADSVKKWNGVTVPPNMKANLVSLSEGVQSFGWLSKGSGSIADYVKPVGDLADSVKKWSGIERIAVIGNDLTKLAGGLQKMISISSGAASLNSLVKPVGDMAVAVKKWNGSKIPSGLGSSLGSLANGLSSLSKVSGLSSLPGKLTDVGGAVVILSLSLMASGSSFASFSGHAKTLNSAFIALSSGMARSTTRISSSVRAMSSSVNSGLTAIVRTANSANSTYKASMNGLVVATRSAATGIGGAFRSATPAVASSASNMTRSAMNAAMSGMRGYTGIASANAVSVGYAISSGMARGIYGGSYMVSAAARSVAARALASAKATLGVHSPSREFAKIGLYSDRGWANGFTDNAKIVSEASKLVAQDALDSAQQILADTSSGFSIKPVVDLSDVSKKARSINTMLAQNQALSVSAGKASAIQSSQDAQQEAYSTEVAASTVSYVQNNYSPKELSATEIYRKTKTQLSKFNDRTL